MGEGVRSLFLEELALLRALAAEMTLLLFSSGRDDDLKGSGRGDADMCDSLASSGVCSLSILLTEFGTSFTEASLFRGFFSAACPSPVAAGVELSGAGAVPGLGVGVAFLEGYGEGERNRVLLLAPPTLGLDFRFISTMCSSANISISADSASFPPA